MKKLILALTIIVSFIFVFSGASAYAYDQFNQAIHESYNFAWKKSALLKQINQEQAQLSAQSYIAPQQSFKFNLAMQNPLLFKRLLLICSLLSLSC